MSLKDFTSFIKENYKKFYNFAFFYLGNREETEDVLQEAFIKIYKKFSSVRNQASLYNWSLKIIRNKCIDFLREQKIKRCFSDISEFLNLKSNPDLTEPDKIYERNLINSQINEALNKLKIKEKEVFILKYYNNLSIKEISKITKLSESNVKVTLFRAVNKLRKIIKNL